MPIDGISCRSCTHQKCRSTCSRKQEAQTGLTQIPTHSPTRRPSHHPQLFQVKFAVKVEAAATAEDVTKLRVKQVSWEHTRRDLLNPTAITAPTDSPAHRLCHLFHSVAAQDHPQRPWCGVRRVPREVRFREEGARDRSHGPLSAGTHARCPAFRGCRVRSSASRSTAAFGPLKT